MRYSVASVFHEFSMVIFSLFCWCSSPRRFARKKKNRRLRHWLVVGGIFVLVRIHAHDTEGVLKRQRGSPGPIAGLPKRLWLVKLVMVIWPYLKNLWPYLGYDSLSMAICSMYVFYSPTKLGHLLR